VSGELILTSTRRAPEDLRLRSFKKLSFTAHVQRYVVSNATKLRYNDYATYHHLDIENVLIYVSSVMTNKVISILSEVTNADTLD